MEKEVLIQFVQQAQQGDTNAISALFTQYKDIVYSIAMRETKGRALSEDIVQETFVEVILKINDLKNPASFPAWLKIMAYHQCTRHYKKKETVHETAAVENDEGWSVFDTVEETNASFIPDEALDQKEFKATILEMIDGLPDAQRAVLHMFYFEEMPLKVIAKIQGVSVNTVNTRLNRGRLAMKDAIEKYEKKHGVRLHSIAFFPFFKWLLKGSEESMPTKSAKQVAQKISAETGITVTTLNKDATSGTVASATSVARSITTSNAVTTGIGAKIAAMPVVGKVVSGILAASLVVGLPAAIVGQSQTTDENISIAETTSEHEETLSVLQNDTPMQVDNNNPYADLGIQCYDASGAFKLKVLNVEGDIYHDYNVSVVDRVAIDPDERYEEEYDGEMYDVQNGESPIINLEHGYYYWMMVHHDRQTIDAVYFSVAVEEGPSTDQETELTIQTGFPVVQKVLQRVEEYKNDYRTAVYTLVYNQEGLVTNFKYILGDSEYWREDTFTYDSNGRIIQHRSDEVDGTFTYTYDGNRLMSYTESYIGEADTQYFLEYDSNGRIIEKASSGSFPGYVTSYEYDGNDRLIKQTTYSIDPTGESEWQNETIYTCDELGNVILTQHRYLSYTLSEDRRELVPYVETLLSTKIDIFDPLRFQYVPNQDVSTMLCLGKDSSGDSCCTISVGRGAQIVIEDGVVVCAESGEYRYELIYEDIQGEILPNPLP